MADLIALLRDCYDEEEVDAHQAMRVLVPIGPTTSEDLPAEPVEWVLNRLPAAVRQHIARHDPARVLREVKAKREILDEMEALLAAADDDRLPDDARQADEATARIVLRLLAKPYSSRPEYAALVNQATT